VILSLDGHLGHTASVPPAGRLYRGTESFRAAKGIRAVRLAANPVWILPLHRVSPLCGNP